MDIKISVIVCTYNRDRFIYETLARIAKNTYPADKYEIILINNNSTDQTAKECQRFHQDYPDVNFRYFIESAQGLSYARNRGIKESKGEILVFLDDDSFIHHTYLQRLANYLKQYPTADAFGGKIKPLFESDTTPRWLGKWTYSWVSAIDKGEKVCLFKGKSYPIGANMGIKRSALPDGLFNTALGRNKGNLMGGEEKDLFNRLKAAHKNIFYFPGIEVMHVIPEKRTTREYIKNLALGVGKSEQLRTMKISRTAYAKALIMEMIKWAASIVLCISYTLIGMPQKGEILLYFRRYVSQGLLSH